MEAYSDFAYVYDTFMDETPYEDWKKYICNILGEFNINDGLVLDLGCGTGKMTRLLKDSGYDMIGVDASYDMLNVARAKESDGILYLCQDMREFELYGTVKAVVSVCDCINYLTDKNDLIKTFKLVNNYLDSKGIFIFDFNTVHKYRDIIGDSVIAENRETCSFIWENSFNRETNINEYDITIFVRSDLLDNIDYSCEDDDLTDEEALDSEEDIEEDFLFGRFSECHIQRGYEFEEIRECIEEAGMEFVRAFDTDTKKEVTSDSERITVIVMEKETKGKLYL